MVDQVRAEQVGCAMRKTGKGSGGRAEQDRVRERQSGHGNEGQAVHKRLIKSSWQVVLGRAILPNRH